MSKKWNLHWLHKQPSHATNRGRNITIQKITIKCNWCVIFDSIQSPLMGGSKLVNNWCTTIFCDTQSTTILSGITKNTIRKIITEAKTDPNNNDILTTVPFGPVALTWQTITNNGLPYLKHILNNIHQIKSKEVSIDYFHRSAGYPMKKICLQTIN